MLPRFDASCLQALCICQELLSICNQISPSINDDILAIDVRLLND